MAGFIVCQNFMEINGFFSSSLLIRMDDAVSHTRKCSFLTEVACLHDIMNYSKLERAESTLLLGLWNECYLRHDDGYFPSWYGFLEVTLNKIVVGGLNKYLINGHVSKANQLAKLFPIDKSSSGASDFKKKLVIIIVVGMTGSQKQKPMAFALGSCDGENEWIEDVPNVFRLNFRVLVGQMIAKVSSTAATLLKIDETFELEIDGQGKNFGCWNNRQMQTLIINSTIISWAQINLRILYVGKTLKIHCTRLEHL